MKVTVDLSEFHFSPEQISETIEKGLDYSSEYVKDVLIQNTPKGKGVAVNSWSIQDNGEYTREVSNSKYYLPFINDGTGIYGKYHRPIVPVRSNVLVFEWHGKTWFLRSVKGQKPTKFVERSLESTRGKIEGLMIKAANEVIE